MCLGGDYMKVLILMIMCIGRMIYLALPTFTLLLTAQIVLYITTKISLYNNLVKLLSK